MTTAQRNALNNATVLAANQVGVPYWLASDGVMHAGPQLSYDASRAYLQALRAIILASPADYAPETIASASSATDPGPLQNYTVADAAVDFVDAAASEARKINPLDSQNIGGIGKQILTAAVILGIAYIVVKNWPPGRSKFAPLPA
jgi:hypothetical protein